MGVVDLEAIADYVALGELTLTMKQNNDDYSMRAEGKTGGIVALFNQHKSAFGYDERELSVK